MGTCPGPGAVLIDATATAAKKDHRLQARIESSAACVNPGRLGRNRLQRPGSTIVCPGVNRLHIGQASEHHHLVEGRIESHSGCGSGIAKRWKLQSSPVGSGPTPHPSLVPTATVSARLI